MKCRSADVPVAAEVDEVPLVVEQEQINPEQKLAVSKRSNDVFLMKWIFTLIKVALPCEPSLPVREAIYLPSGRRRFLLLE
ncbi:MAG TPA: hypothetical protein VE641_06630 [Chthoniobacterales bacterium]|nr:hypothetical protein [Chthoniobacterales bacterium]